MEADLKLTRNFGIIYRRSQSYMTRACSEYGLSFSEFVLLVHLYERESFNQESMAALLDVDKAIIARTIKLLEEKQLVKRVQDEQDKRAKKLYLTEAGWEMKRSVNAIVEKWIDFLKQAVDSSLINPLSQAIGDIADRVVNEECGLPIAGKGAKCDE